MAQFLKDRIRADGSWLAVCVTGTFVTALGLIWLVRNTLDLAGITDHSGWSNSGFHYALGYFAVSLYIIAYILLIRRYRIFVFVYLTGAISRWIYWGSQAPIEGFPIHIGFVALAADALVLMTSIRWFLPARTEK